MQFEEGELEQEWFRKRTYKHFDRPVNSIFVENTIDPSFVSTHSFAPLIQFNKVTKKYKLCAVERKRKVVKKSRAIMYASHKDACILSYYSSLLGNLLNNYYYENDLDENVIAYRSLGRSNYDFSAKAYNFAMLESPVSVLAFDVSGFFDNLDHKLLKSKLKRILNMDELPKDWYAIYKFVTKFHYVKKDELKLIPAFLKSLDTPGVEPIATVAELKREKINFYPNPTHGRGIPQGTPISATLSNLYLMAFDKEIKDFCVSIGAFYQRYSDDILVICSPEREGEVSKKIKYLMDREKLSLNEEKTEIRTFDKNKREFTPSDLSQYLGFSFGYNDVFIRQSSMARQWRKMRKSIQRTKRYAEINIQSGKSNKVYTKKLRRKFSPLQYRNFSSYARRGAHAFNSRSILKQTRRLERAFEMELQKIKSDLEKP
ncbi:MAG: Reverse transcriptase [Sneathiella sp.]|nr:Reverse transcriptase [Sneathiella sp.]